MPKLGQKGLIVPIIIIGIVITTITVIGVMRLFSILPGNVSEREAKSIIGDFAKFVSNAKLPTRSTIVAEPPWEAIKLVEKYANGKIAKDARIDYQLYGSSVNNISLYVFAKPFRWRVDFASSYEDHYRAILINNNGEYSSCYYSDKDGKNCAKVGKLEELGIPYELTGLLNTILDTALLNQFIKQTPKSSTRTIAAKEADCLTINDNHDELHPRDFIICTDKESKMPLFLGFKHDNCETPMLEATSIMISPLSPEEALPSAELLDKLAAPKPPAKPVEKCADDTSISGNDDVANWQTYTNATWGYSIKYPSQFHQQTVNGDTKPDPINKPDFTVKSHQQEFAYGGDYIRINVTPAGFVPLEVFDAGEYDEVDKKVNIDGIMTNSFIVGENIYLNPIIHNNYEYHFMYSWTDKKNDDLFYKMLSTFTAPSDETANWKTYNNKNLKIQFRYPEDLDIAEENESSVTVGQKADNGYIKYLTITNNSKEFTDYKSIKLCSQVSSKTCIASEGWGQTEPIKKIKLDEVDAVSFYLGGGVDSAKHVVQTTAGPKIELSMDVAGGGLDKTFNQILSTFKFLK